MTTCLFLPTCVALDEPGPPVVSVGTGTSTGLPPGAKTADVDDVSSSVYAAVKVHDDNDDADDDAMVLGVEAVRRRRDEKVSLLGGEGGRSGSSSDDESVSDGAVLRKP